ncbi:MAG: hypothetical protein ACR2PZ_09085 [Pseudomonadales bacterium]
MRFVVGLCFGSLLMLATAALLDWPGTQQKPAVTDELGLGSDEQITQTPAPFNPAPSAQQTAIDTPVPDLEAVAPASVPQWRSLTEASAEPVETAETAIAPITSPAPEQPEVAMDESSEALPDWIAEEFATTDAPDPSAAESDPTGVEPETMTASTKVDAGAQGKDFPATDALPQVAVWRPFHSQMSAEGFAKRLSLQLGYPFTVVKVGAARYHVVFSYQDSAERDLLAEQLTALTGYTPR